METNEQILRFQRPAIVLKQPLLVALTIAFVLALLVARFGPWGGGDMPAAESNPEPVSAWVWLFWAVVLAIVAGGVWMLCHAEEIVVDARQQRVTQTHRFLHHEVKTNQLPFANFNGIAVVLQIDKEHQGTSSTSGTSTLTTGRTVYTSRYELQLRRPDLVLKTAERTLTAPAHALHLPLADDKNPLAVEALARALARLGGWPAVRQHYTLLPQGPAADGGAPYTVKIIAGADDPLV